MFPFELKVVSIPVKNNFRAVKYREIALFQGPEGHGAVVAVHAEDERLDDIVGAGDAELPRQPHECPDECTVADAACGLVHGEAGPHEAVEPLECLLVLDGLVAPADDAEDGLGVAPHDRLVRRDLLHPAIHLGVDRALLDLPVECRHAQGCAARDGTLGALAEAMPDGRRARREELLRAVLADGDLMAHVEPPFL